MRLLNTSCCDLQSLSSLPMNLATQKRPILVIGKESTGKSQLIASLTGCSIPGSANFRGSTVACETFEGENHSFVDTPGILYRSDSATTRAALDQLEGGETVLLVVQATHVDEDLRELLPLVAGKQGVVAITFWDKIRPEDELRQIVERWHQTSHLDFFTVDPRNLLEGDRTRLLQALEYPSPFPDNWIPSPIGWCIEPKLTWLEHPRWGWLFAIALLLLPAIVVVWTANSFAEMLDPIVRALLNPLVNPLQQLFSPMQEILVGRYGLITMGPLLFVWAVPTVILYALFLGAYKASGLVDRITVAINTLLRPIGLTGRDLVRVIMGFGCNVPAVISTRACSSCSRGTCVSAIAFGSACSYQLGATLGVFSAANQPWLVIPYLLYLTVTTLIYARLVANSAARSPRNPLVIEQRCFLEFPRWSAIWREASGTLNQFFSKAIPIFLLITIIASLLDWLGAISDLASLLDPLMGVFRLPTEAAVPIILASIRKDGLLLFAEDDLLATLTPPQLLSGVYLAGVLLPCLVTVLTIAREQSPRFALFLMSRQAFAAIAFSVVLAWGGLLL